MEMVESPLDQPGHQEQPGELALGIERSVRLAVEAAGVGTFELGNVRRSLEWSDRMKALFGFAPVTHVTRELWLSRVHPADRERADDLVTRCIDEGGVYRDEYRILGPGGVVRWIGARGRAVTAGSAEEQCLTVIGVAGEVTERHETQERFRLLADAAPVMIWTANAHMLCDFFNRPWLDFTGRPLGQELGNGWAEGVHPEDLERCMDTYLSAARARQRFAMEYRLRRSDGEYRWILDNGVPLYDADAVFSGYIGSCIDITELKGLESERLARARAEAAVQARDDFLGIVTHDIRGPLSAVSLGATAIDRLAPVGAEGAALRDAAGRIRRACETMSALVDDLLDVASIDSGNLSLRLELLDVAMLVEEASEMFLPIAAQASITFVREASVHRRVRGDRKRIAQVFSNLISNALKFTEAGGTIRVQASSRRGSLGDEVCFSVSDTGCGIPADQLGRVFERFFQGGGRSRAGAGLGLYIARRIVETHGGRVWVESEVGKGTTVFFALPADED
jgi:PAS domain S-box-containing protein